MGCGGTIDVLDGIDQVEVVWEGAAVGWCAGMARKGKRAGCGCNVAAEEESTSGGMTFELIAAAGESIARADSLSSS